MRKNKEIKVGQQFNRWKVIELNNERDKNNIITCKVQCLCSNKTIRNVSIYSLLGGISKSCGCIRIENTKISNFKHGFSKTRLAYIYQNMLSRCYNVKNIDYHNYGGRGIIVCDEWINDSKLFYNWAINNGYDSKLTIDRIDTNGNYEPNNCKWSTQEEQSNNMRKNITITAFGENKTIAQWSRDSRCKVSPRCLYKRINSGYSPEIAITKNPINRKRKYKI